MVGARRLATLNGPSRCEKEKRGGDKEADFRHSAAEPLDFAGGIYGKSRWKKSAARMGELGREDSFLISFAKKKTSCWMPSQKKTRRSRRVFLSVFMFESRHGDCGFFSFQVSGDKI
ncbi:hypothetical protein [Caldibacillus debilis]|uniref:hypothetical protein n=1 Tax=Caldibacillus debilis TaxID=301148 RepID=UPI00128FDC07|nr:hypothetical protein [Caldibacillus debilis]